MNFLKEDLLYHHYHWVSEADTDVFTGQPSRRLFDRFNGQQVLFIINFYGGVAEKFSLLEARQMEEMINNRLPLEAKSEISVFNWLRSVC
jgi:hypothetical protein